MLRAVILLTLAVAFAGCKAKRGEEDVPEAGSTTVAPAAAEPAALPQRRDSACPECEGLGVCRRCADERPCLSCDGGGVCAICEGSGRTRDGSCEACGGGGRCPACGGDGIVSRTAGETGGPGGGLPGQCPDCLFGSGWCGDCGGAGTRPDGGTCARCGGEKWCPGCRGSGLDPWCSGRGLCGSCEGHGQVVGGRPGTGWPDLRIALASGEVVIAKVLERPGETLSIERTRGARTVRESIAAKNVDPVGYLAALGRYLNPEDPAEWLKVAEYALEQGDDYLFLARAALADAGRRGDDSPRWRALTDRAGRRFVSFVAGAAERALREEKDPAKAWRLFSLVHSVAGGAEPAAAKAGRAEAKAAIAAESAGLGAAPRERRRAVEAERLARAVRRAGEWRARAERILGRTGASAVELERAAHAAERAWDEVVRAMDRAPADLDRRPAGEEAVRAAAVASRATVATGLRVLAAGRYERARALASIALARDPESPEALRLSAVATEALAREATEREDGR